jgi:hypothetical protein
MQMKQSVVLTVASMMSILLLTFHLTDGIVRGFEKGRADQSDGGADLRGLGFTPHSRWRNGERVT